MWRDEVEERNVGTAFAVLGALLQVSERHNPGDIELSLRSEVELDRQSFEKCLAAAHFDVEWKTGHILVLRRECRHKQKRKEDKCAI